jgi:hypothetical protein
MALVLSAALLDSMGPSGYCFIVVVLTALQTGLLATYLPYYALATNQLQVALSLVHTWASLCMAMAETSHDRKVDTNGCL